ncbi:hypothetical protein ACQ4PT_011023 [Festuca glaucescens]
MVGVLVSVWVKDELDQELELTSVPVLAVEEGRQELLVDEDLGHACGGALPGCKKLAGEAMVSATIASLTMLPSLPDDAIFEILSWVPVKPACRFRCVSRGWRALISSPAFLTTHKSHVEPLLLSITTSPPPEVNSTLRLMDIDGNIVRVIEKPGLWTIKYSLHGPICVRIADYDVSVIDLATLNVVRTSVELNHELFCSLNVGCAVPSRKYKVVCLMRKYDPCKVLTLEDGAKWRQVKSPPTPPLLTNGYNLGSAVTVNGVMHFLYEVEIPQVDEDYVLGFDLESEEWKFKVMLLWLCLFLGS